MAMRKGINGWNFPAGTPWAQAAKQARQAGFEAIEPTLGGTGELTPVTDEATCRRLADEIRAAGLEIGSLACGLFWQWNYSSPEPESRKKARDLTIACLDRARWMGAPAILVVPGVVAHFEHPGRIITSYEQALQHTFDALRDLATEAEARGVIIAIENVWNQFLISPVEMRELIDRVNSAWVGAYLDVGNILRYGFPQDWIDTLGRRIVRVHLKDFKLAVATLEGFCPLGDGDVDWPAVMAALKRQRYDGPMAFEGPGDLNDISRRIDRVMAAG